MTDQQADDPMPGPTATPADPLVAALRRPAPQEDTPMTRLLARLVVRADRDGLLDLAYTTTDSPLGPLLLAATSTGLVRLAYRSEDHDAVLSRLADRISPRVLHAPQRLDPVRRQLDEYFAGARRRFEVPLDMQLSTPFRRTVLAATAALPYGTTASYGQIAAAVGNPAAVRATGTALATNPVPIVVPCHRILRGDGALGGYVGGAPAKRALLDLERRAP